MMINVDPICVCGYRPGNPHEHEDMLADLAVEWWMVAHGRIRRASFCCQCAPETFFASIDCVYCGSGPLVTLTAPTLPAGAFALIRVGLESSGWHNTPAGEWVCRGCQTGR
jgi:hypothetical protein